MAFPFDTDATMPFTLNGGTELDVPLWRTEFAAATDTLDLGPWTYNIKPQLSWNDEPLLAELLIAQILEAEGWSAAWVDSFANERLRVSMPPGTKTLEVPATHLETLSRVRVRLGKGGGRWDVFGFRGKEVAFIESKGPSDSINLNQRAWLAAAIEEAIPKEAFAVVEWRFSNPVDAERVRLERRARLKPKKDEPGSVSPTSGTRGNAGSSSAKRWRPLEHELEDLLSDGYQDAVGTKARSHGIEPFTLVMDNSLRRIRAGAFMRKSRNRPLIKRGLASGEAGSPQITAAGTRLLEELDRELGGGSYPDSALE